MYTTYFTLPIVIMTFKKVLGLIALACLTIIGLSACTLDKESTWTYDKNKMQFVVREDMLWIIESLLTAAASLQKR